MQSLVPDAIVRPSMRAEKAVLRCHFDLYGSRGFQIDPIGDDFQDVDAARKMARVLLLDYAQHRFSDGGECVIVCEIRTENPERFYLTSLAITDEVVSTMVSGPPVPEVSGRGAMPWRPGLHAAEESEVAYRMSADWADLRELRSGGILSDIDGTERAWLAKYIPFEERPRVVAAIDQAIHFRAPFNLEHKVIRADETIGWTASRALPVVDENGCISEWVGVAKDVTARHAS